MKKIVVEGGWYGECRPDGHYAVLVPDQYIQTDEGTLPLPEGDNPLYLRISPTGSLQMAGQPHHAGPGTWHWIAGQGWHRDPRTSHGTSGHIFKHRRSLQHRNLNHRSL